MTQSGYRKLVSDMAESKDLEMIDLVSKSLFEAQEAKQELRSAGYGCTGMGILSTVREVLT